MAWELDSKQSIYGQLVDIILRRIVTGVYPPGSRLDSVRDLATEAGVNPNTMQRAFAELERTGIIVTQRTSGRFVTDDEEMVKTIREELAIKAVENMKSELRELGYEDGEIIELVSKEDK